MGDSEPSPAVLKKQEGNAAFSAKDYEKALTLYTEAIELDPSSHVLYSNRSAAHCALKNFKGAEEDAANCIKLAADNNTIFIKGYYRLANAQLDQGNHDNAMKTVRAGLKIDSQNTELAKLVRLIKARKEKQRQNDRKAKDGVPILKPGELSQEDQQQLQELQNQYDQMSKEHQTVANKLGMYERDQQRLDLTLKEMSDLEDNRKMFRSVGKMFMSATKEEVCDHLALQKSVAKKKSNELEARKAYLAKKKTSHEVQVREILQTHAGGAQ